MLKVYFKQTVQMLKQNRFISVISILGTALAVMMIMTIVVVHEMKVLGVDPEPNRDRTLYITMFQLKSKPEKERQIMKNMLDEERVQELTGLKTPEAIAVFSDVGISDPVPVRAEGQREEYLVMQRATNTAYWNVFTHRFREGRPYTEEEVHSGSRVAVLSESLARQLYREASPIGKGFVADYKIYRVIGVVEDVSQVFSDACGDFWVPYTTVTDVYRAVLLTGGKREDYAAVNAEIHALEEKFSVENDTYNLNYIGPFTLWQKQSGVSGFMEEDMEKAIKTYNRKQIFILLILLLIPALNLSGFSLSRVKKRMAEIGVRKAFGAKRATILVQILSENFITSLIGGLIGLALSWTVLFNFRHWLLGIQADEALPLSVMVSPFTWLAVFAACFALNLLSAGVPAWRAARMNIIDSINQNNKTI